MSACSNVGLLQKTCMSSVPSTDIQPRSLRFDGPLLDLRRVLATEALDAVRTRGFLEAGVR